MRTYPIRTPRLIQQVFPNWIWRGTEKEKIIYLTFDDGPTPEITDWTLEQLSIYDAKATFFCIGKNMKTHPALVSNILKSVHTVVNHTYDHDKGWKTTSADYLKSVTKTQSLIDEIKANLVTDKVSTNRTYFRHHYGKIRL